MKRGRSWLAVPPPNVRRKIWRLVYEFVLGDLLMSTLTLRWKLDDAAECSADLFAKCRLKLMSWLRQGRWDVDVPWKIKQLQGSWYLVGEAIWGLH